MISKYDYMTYNGSLTHHGILGQKWGKRNGPPYPLKASDHSASEKKAGWHKSLDEGEKQNTSSEKRIDSNVKNLINKSLNEIGTVGMSEEAVSFLAESAAVLVMSAAMIAAPRIRVKREINDNVKRNNTNIQKKINGPHTEEEDMAATNPNYKTQKPEYLSNCVLCSTAYELRRRGYDVEANTSKIGRTDSNVIKYFDVSKEDMYKTKSYDKFVNEINKQPEGARGNVLAGVGYFDSGHSMVWEKKNGKIIIRDCQDNTVYDSIKASPIRTNSSHQYRFIRTDNASLNWDNLRDAVVERED